MKLRGGPNKLSKLYYSTNGYWKGYAAISKLADEAKVSENEAKNGLKNKHYGKFIYQLQNIFPGLTGESISQTKFTKQIYCFYHMTHIGRKPINTH